MYYVTLIEGSDERSLITLNVKDRQATIKNLMTLLILNSGHVKKFRTSSANHMAFLKYVPM